MDKRRQELEELQDDIHLALLMDEYADSIGAQVRAKAEKAFESGEMSIPKELDDACASILAQTTKAEQGKKSTKTVFRYLLVAVGTVIALLGTLMVVQAAGIDVFGRLASWTDSVFHYSSEKKPAQTEEEPLTEIKTALTDLGLPTDLAPSRLPEDFSIISIKQTETDEMKYLAISVEKDDHKGQIIIEEYKYAGLIENALWEKNSQSARLFSSNNRDFYLVENEQGWSGTWSDGKYNISLFGFDSDDELIYIIQSIGEEV